MEDRGSANWGRANGDHSAAAGGCLTIDLGALVANYRTLQSQVRAKVGAVVKADAYGLGAYRVGPALARAGCGDFFVAHLAEALDLKPHLPAEARLYVLNGLWAGTEAQAAAAGVLPVLNSLDQARGWRELARAQGRRAPAVLQIDTGMSRLGLSAEEAAALAADPGFFEDVDVRYLMSHFACADEPDSPANAAQLAQFERLAAQFPPLPRSLSNSAACFAHPAAHGELARPGLALYGAAPVAGRPNPVRPVVGLTARVIQVRAVEAGAGVGYGMTYRVGAPTRLATICVGYADGWPRALSNRGAVYFQGRRLPVVGRVSMDSLIVDVSALPPGAIGHGDSVELIGPNQTLEDVAEQAGTIAYEILTNLGRRYARVYVGEDGAVSAGQ